MFRVLCLLAAGTICPKKLPALSRSKSSSSCVNECCRMLSARANRDPPARFLHRAGHSDCCRQENPVSKNYSLLSRPSTRRDDKEAIAVANDTNRNVVNVAPPGLAAVEAVRLTDDLDGE